MKKQEGVSDSRTVRADQDPIRVIESLMARERNTLEQDRTNAFVATEPHLKILFARLADVHSGIYAELRSLLDEVKSRRKITEQINDVYR
jgi:rubrerythrin